MYIFTCDNTFEDMMCCIYHAWEKALKVGHGCVRLEKRGEEQISLFDEYIYIEYNEEEYKKVVRSIKHKISEEAYACVYYACLLGSLIVRTGCIRYSLQVSDKRI